MFDWQQWQSLPVQDGGRQKPLDTLARETLRTINGRSSVSDAKTHEPLDPTAFYLSLYFTWQGWDRPGASPHGMPAAAVCPGQPAKEQEDAWDREPLLLVGSVPLRTAMGLPPEQKYISALDLSAHMIDIPKSGVKSRFLVWVQTLLRDGPRKPDKLQKNGMELAERYWAYKDARCGRKLEVLPLSDSKTQQWVSAARLMQTNWDDKTDATGKIRKAKGELQKARAAYLKNSAEDFNAASANFIALLRDVGPELGNYPSPGVIRLEVAYNRWAPFRIAWVCTLLALLSMPLMRASRGRLLRAVPMILYGAGDLGDVSRLWHTHGDCRTGTGDQHVRVGDLCRPGDRRAGSGVSSRISQITCAGGRCCRLRSRADT